MFATLIEARAKAPKGYIYRSGGTNYNPDQYTGFISLLQSVSPQDRAVEVGVFDGDVTEFMAHTFKHVVAVDIWGEAQVPWLPFQHIFNDAEERFDERMAGYDNVAKVKLPSVEAAKLFDDHSFDLVYLDADHSYTSLRDDIAAWRTKVKPGGTLAGHDYMWAFPGIKKAVDEQFSSVKLFKDSSWAVRC